MQGGKINIKCVLTCVSQWHLRRKEALECWQNKYHMSQGIFDQQKVSFNIQCMISGMTEVLQKACGVKLCLFCFRYPSFRIVI